LQVVSHYTTDGGSPPKKNGLGPLGPPGHGTKTNVLPVWPLSAWEEATAGMWKRRSLHALCSVGLCLIMRIPMMRVTVMVASLKRRRQTPCILLMHPRMHTAHQHRASERAN